MYFHQLGPKSNLSEDRAVRGGTQETHFWELCRLTVSISEPGPSIGFDRRQTTHILAAAEIQAHHFRGTGGQKNRACVLAHAALALGKVFPSQVGATTLYPQSNLDFHEKKYKRSDLALLLLTSTLATLSP